MITPRGVSLACLLSGSLFAFACGDGENAGFAGSSGQGGAGGSGGGPDAFVSCVDLPNGCDDGNDCTVDGNCESITGMCIGRAPEPRDMACGRNGIFVCDGEGACVGCNTDEQCEPFFPDEECRVAPRCIDQGCPLPAALPNGTPCSTGECRDGVCTSPWAPKQQLVPMICGVSFGDNVYETQMTLTVAPTPISSAEPFSAAIDASIRLPRELLQDLVTGRFPDSLEDFVVSAARAEVESSGVVSGTPVETTLDPLPQQVGILQTPNFGDSGGQPCAAPSDCPLAEFGQLCGLASGCVCACRPGCFPSECPNVVISDVVLPMETIQGAIYSPLLEGAVCFDAAGDYVSPTFTDPVRTGARVVSSLGPFAVECAGGFIDDDAIVPNPVDTQVCFPIAEP